MRKSRQTHHPKAAVCCAPRIIHIMSCAPAINFFSAEWGTSSPVSKLPVKLMQLANAIHIHNELARVLRAQTKGNNATRLRLVLFTPRPAPSNPTLRSARTHFIRCSFPCSLSYLPVRPLKGAPCFKGFISGLFAARTRTTRHHLTGKL